MNLSRKKKWTPISPKKPSVIQKVAAAAPTVAAAAVVAAAGAVQRSVKGMAEVYTKARARSQEPVKRECHLCKKMDILTDCSVNQCTNMVCQDCIHECRRCEKKCCMRKDLIRYELKIETVRPPTSRKMQDGTEERFGCLRSHELSDCPKIRENQ